VVASHKNLTECGSLPQNKNEPEQACFMEEKRHTMLEQQRKIINHAHVAREILRLRGELYKHAK
jgi:hypothetical protein